MYPRSKEQGGVDALLFEAKDEPDPVRWKAAAQENWSMFWERGAGKVVDKLHVQIEDYDRSYCYLFLALLDEPEIISAITAVRENVLETVKVMMPGVWTSVAYHIRVHGWYRCGKDVEPKPSMTVLCKRSIAMDFKSVEERIMQLLEDAPVDIHVPAGGTYANLTLLTLNGCACPASL